MRLLVWLMRITCVHDWYHYKGMKYRKTKSSVRRCELCDRTEYYDETKQRYVKCAESEYQRRLLGRK